MTNSTLQWPLRDEGHYMTYNEFLDELIQFPDSGIEYRCSLYTEIQKVTGLTFIQSETGEIVHNTDKDLITAFCTLDLKTCIYGHGSYGEHRWWRQYIHSGEILDPHFLGLWHRYINEKLSGNGGTLWSLYDYDFESLTEWV